MFAHTTSLRYHSDMTQNLPLCYSYTSRAAHHTLRPASRTTLRSLSQSASREPPSLARTLSQLIGFRGWFGRQECHAVQTAHLKSSEFNEIVQNHWFLMKSEGDTLCPLDSRSRKTTGFSRFLEKNTIFLFQNVLQRPWSCLRPWVFQIYEKNLTLHIQPPNSMQNNMFFSSNRSRSIRTDLCLFGEATLVFGIGLNT